MGVVSEVERELARLRYAQQEDGVTGLRASTMTHLVWAPPRWLEQARKTLAGLDERHPARTIFLIPEPQQSGGVRARVRLRETAIEGGREVLAEVVELRLRGAAVEHPASLLLPLLVPDLPVFCRWRGEPPWGTTQLAEIVDVVDRLVVDSNEWSGLPAAYERFVHLFSTAAVSDIAYARTLPWRVRLAELWPGIGTAERLRVEGPKADALLLAGWVRSRLRREIRLTRRSANTLSGVWVDGEPLEPPSEPVPSGSDLLSAELDAFSRDPVFEAAVRTAM
jgi:Glucose-6-phosphate dehydrogenase subunit N-terminal domain